MRHLLGQFTLCAVILLFSVISLRGQEAEPEIPPAETSRVWAEYGVATIDVGFDVSHHSNVYRKVLLGVIGPVEVVADAHDATRRCTLDALASSSDDLSNLLDSAISPFSQIESELINENQPIDPDSIQKAHEARIRVISQIFALKNALFHQKLRSCMGGFGDLAGKFHVAVVLRVCEPFGSRPCQGPPFTRNSENASFYRFQKVYEWLSVTGYPAINVWQELATEGKPNLPYDTPIELFRPSEMWPAVPSQMEALEQFERGVTRYRSANLQFDYPTAYLMGLSKDNALHVIDVFRSPARTISTLSNEPVARPVVKFESYDYLGNSVAVAQIVPTIPVSIQFEFVSDEVARSRITECARFRGQSDATDVANCSGYDITDRMLNDCLGDRLCVPAFGENALGSVLAINSPRTIEELRIAAALPRIKISGTIKDFENAAVECQHSHPGNPAEASLCALRLRSNDKTAVTLGCIADAKLQTLKTTDCLLSNATSEANKNKLACFANIKSDPRASILCAANDNLSPNARRIVTCMQMYNKSHNAQEAALCASGGLLNDDQRLALECIQAHPNGWSGAAACVAAKKAELPPMVSDTLECAQLAGADPKKFAACLALKNVPGAPGELGKLARCAVLNQGSGLATGACMASDVLTPEQQIALQCASSSPDITTFAVCTGGQLAAREFVKCQNVRFGQGECFGPNNEIRKFIKNVLNLDISDSSLVGQILNVQLDVIKFQVAFAEVQLKALQQIANGALQVGVMVANGVAHVASELANQVEQAREIACNNLVCIAGIPTPLPKINIPSPPHATINGTCIPACW